MSAGTGILHSEKNDFLAPRRRDASRPVHFVQMWVVPDGAGATPGYEQLEIDEARLTSGLSRSPRHAEHAEETAIRIGNRYAALHAARSPRPVGRAARGPFLPLSSRRNGHPRGRRRAGRRHAVRFTATAGSGSPATEAAEVLVWEMHATLSN